MSKLAQWFPFCCRARNKTGKASNKDTITTDPNGDSGQNDHKLHSIHSPSTPIPTAIPTKIIRYTSTASDNSPFASNETRDAPAAGTVPPTALVSRESEPFVDHWLQGVEDILLGTEELEFDSFSHLSTHSHDSEESNRTPPRSHQDRMSDKSKHESLTNEQLLGVLNKLSIRTQEELDELMEIVTFLKTYKSRASSSPSPVIANQTRNSSNNSSRKNKKSEGENNQQLEEEIVRQLAHDQSRRLSTSSSHQQLISQNEVRSLAKIFHKKKQFKRVKALQQSNIKRTSTTLIKSQNDPAPTRSKPIENSFNFQSELNGYDESEEFDRESTSQVVTKPIMMVRPTNTITIDRTSPEYLLEREIITTIIDDVLIDYNDIVFISKVGEGAFAEVFEALYHNPQSGITERVAVKRLKQAPMKLNQLKSFAREVSLLKRTSRVCTNTVKILGACISPQCCIVMDFVEGGSVSDWLSRPGNNNILNLETALCYARDIGEGIKQLHSMKPPIIHRDIHLQNILVQLNCNNNNNNNDVIVTKLLLGDFGIARLKEEKGNQQYTPTGHPRYRAPEITKKQPYSKRVDVYCFGSCLYELVTGTKMYGDVPDIEVSKLRTNGQLPAIPNHLPKGVRKLIQKCWRNEAKQRPTIAEVLRSLDKEINKARRS